MLQLQHWYLECQEPLDALLEPCSFATTCRPLDPRRLVALTVPTCLRGYMDLLSRPAPLPHRHAPPINIDTFYIRPFGSTGKGEEMGHSRVHAAHGGYGA